MALIGELYPNIQCHCPGDGTDYNAIVVDGGGALPSQVDLDGAVHAYQSSKMTALITAERNRRTSTGGYKVGTKWFHSDDTSRIQQLALVMMGAGIPTNIMWKTMDGSFVPMTQTLAGQIFQTAAASDMNFFAAALNKIAAANALDDPMTYDYQSGWPLIFGE
jgi:hypothetical protein